MSTSFVIAGPVYSLSEPETKTFSVFKPDQQQRDPAIHLYLKNRYAWIPQSSWGMTKLELLDRSEQLFKFDELGYSGEIILTVGK